MYYELKDYFEEYKDNMDCTEMLHSLYVIMNESYIEDVGEQYVMDIAIELYDKSETLEDAIKRLKKFEYVTEERERRIVTLLIDICIYYR